MDAGDKYLWTNHSRIKMRHYRLTESRIKRIIRHPARIEEGILEGAVACMQPAEGKRYSEVWVMYLLTRGAGTFLRHVSSRPARDSLRVGAISRLLAGPSKSRLPLSQKRPATTRNEAKRIKVITAWRYPGKSPERDPIPQEILREIKNII